MSPPGGRQCPRDLRSFESQAHVSRILGPASEGLQWPSALSGALLGTSSPHRKLSPVLNVVEK